MINMEYCRFENTAIALEECLGYLERGGKIDNLSKSEKYYSALLYSLAIRYDEIYHNQTNYK